MDFNASSSPSDSKAALHAEQFNLPGNQQPPDSSEKLLRQLYERREASNQQSNRNQTEYQLIAQNNPLHDVTKPQTNDPQPQPQEDSEFSTDNLAKALDKANAGDVAPWVDIVQHAVSHDQDPAHDKEKKVLPDVIQAARESASKKQDNGLVAIQQTAVTAAVTENQPDLLLGMVDYAISQTNLQKTKEFGEGNHQLWVNSYLYFGEYLKSIGLDRQGRWWAEQADRLSLNRAKHLVLNDYETFSTMAPKDPQYEKIVDYVKKTEPTLRTALESAEASQKGGETTQRNTEIAYLNAEFKKSDAEFKKALAMLKDHPDKVTKDLFKSVFESNRDIFNDAMDRVNKDPALSKELLSKLTQIEDQQFHDALPLLLKLMEKDPTRAKQIFDSIFKNSEQYADNTKSKMLALVSTLGQVNIESKLNLVETGALFSGFLTKPALMRQELAETLWGFDPKKQRQQLTPSAQAQSQYIKTLYEAATRDATVAYANEGVRQFIVAIHSIAHDWASDSDLRTSLEDKRAGAKERKDSVTQKLMAHLMEIGDTLELYKVKIKDQTGEHEVERLGLAQQINIAVIAPENSFDFYNQVRKRSHLPAEDLSDPKLEKDKFAIGFEIAAASTATIGTMLLSNIALKRFGLSSNAWLQAARYPLAFGIGFGAGELTHKAITGEFNNAWKEIVEAEGPVVSYYLAKGYARGDYLKNSFRGSGQALTEDVIYSITGKAPEQVMEPITGLQFRNAWQEMGFDISRLGELGRMSESEAEACILFKDGKVALPNVFRGQSDKELANSLTEFRKKVNVGEDQVLKTLATRGNLDADGLRSRVAQLGHSMDWIPGLQELEGDLVVNGRVVRTLNLTPYQGKVLLGNLPPIKAPPVSGWDIFKSKAKGTVNGMGFVLDRPINYQEDVIASERAIKVRTIAQTMLGPFNWADEAKVIEQAAREITAAKEGIPVANVAIDKLNITKGELMGWAGDQSRKELLPPGVTPRSLSEKDLRFIEGIQLGDGDNIMTNGVTIDRFHVVVNGTGQDIVTHGENPPGFLRTSRALNTGLIGGKQGVVFDATSSVAWFNPSEARLLARHRFFTALVGSEVTYDSLSFARGLADPGTEDNGQPRSRLNAGLINVWESSGTHQLLSLGTNVVSGVSVNGFQLHWNLGAQLFETFNKPFAILNMTQHAGELGVGQGMLEAFWGIQTFAPLLNGSKSAQELSEERLKNNKPCLLNIEGQCSDDNATTEANKAPAK